MIFDWIYDVIKIIFIIIIAVCQVYQWNCTAPNENGQRYIPSDRDRDAFTSRTYGNQLYVYSFSNLDTSCYGPVNRVLLQIQR